MAEDEARELVSRPASDPSALTTNALHRAIEDVKELFNIRLTGEIKSQDARIAAIEKAADVFSQSLTTVPTAVDRAVGELRTLHDSRFRGMAEELRLAREVIQTRFDGMDTALALLQAIADRFPERIDEKIGSLKEIHDGQFDAIQVQFRERDTRTAETSKQSEVAISAALQAAKEAVGKSEVVTSKQIEDVKALFNTLSGALRDRLDEFTERFARIEGVTLGQAGQKTEQHTSSSFIVGLVGIGLAVISALIALSAFIRPGK